MIQKNLFTFLFSIAGILNLYSQNVNLSKDKINNMLCHIWKVDYAMINEAKIPIQLKIEIQFNVDNTYFALNSPEKKGVWELDELNKCINLKLNNKVSRIIQLNENEMTFVELDNNPEARSTPRNSKFHFIRSEN